MAFDIRNPGLATTVQDQGRTGHYNVGIPQSGSLDQYSAELGNALVGNTANEAVLECTYLGPVLSTDQDALIAVTGAPVEVKVNGEARPQWTRLQLKAGDELSFGVIQGGTRYYIAVRGGKKLTSKDVEMMVGFLAIHARYFVALSRLAEGYLNALNPPRQTFNMSGQVMFLDPEDVEDGIAELAEHGLESKIREDLVDECGPTVFVDVFGTSDLGASEFLHWLSDLAEPLGGDVNEAGYADDPAPAPYGNVVPLGA